ncbi:MAG TPA: AI-2E family transporter [Bryobacteraceae bacterium]|nr:AI-2E family transporter [Bryobacteraceae bacterium]
MPRLAPTLISKPLAGRTEERSPFWWLRWVPALFFTSLLLYLGYLVGRVAIVPVLASFSLAYVLSPVVEKFEARGFSRLISALLALICVCLLMAGFAYFVIPDLWHQSTTAGTAILEAFNEQNARAARQDLREFSPMLDRMIGYRLYSFLRSPNALIQASQSWFAGSLTSFLASAADLADLLLIPFFVFYILVDFTNWRGSSEELIPPRFRAPFSRLFDEVGRILQSYVLGQIMIAIIMGLLYGLGFALLQVPAWPGIAALSGFLNVVPYVGTGLGLVLATGFTFASDQNLWRVGGVIGVFIAVQMVEGYFLTPRILGDRLALHPMAVFLGLLVGGKLFGFLGVLLAVPVIAVSMVFYKFLREIYKTSEFYRAGEYGPEPQPGKVEDVIERAADSVLAEQVDKQTGNEILAPSKHEDDPAAREKSA